MEGKRKILVADDEEVIRDLFYDFLDGKGYEVVTANDGKEAIDKIKEEEIDAAFIDVILPGKDGLEVLREIKKIRPGVEVIMITAYEVKDELKAARQEGAYACLQKPFRVKEVIDILEKIFSGAKNE